MKNIHAIIIILPLLVINCSSLLRSSPNTDDYFPLKAGNKWYYSSSYPDTTSINIIWQVSGRIEINKKQYYEVVEKNLQFNKSDIVFYRLSQDTLFYKTKTSAEQIIADFALNLHDTCYWNTDARVSQKTNKLIEFSIPFGADYGMIVVYKKGLGITRWISNGYIYSQLTLVKADIK